MIKKAKRVIAWFRQDLRLHDNEMLCKAQERGIEVFPVFVFDPRQITETTNYGFKKSDKFRLQFLIESVENLRANLKEKGINLIVRIGKPEEEVFELARQLKTSWVFANMERTYEEVQVQNELENNLWTIGQELHLWRGKMLYYTQDLPFPISHTPDIFTHFRKEVEKFVKVRTPLEAPESFEPWSIYIPEGDIPSLSDFGFEDVLENDPRATFQLKGGESEGKKRLQYYLWDSDLIKTYYKTRNGLLGGDYSSKLSSWLALGCLSPKYVYYEIKAYEAKRKSNKSTYWLFFELLWRDFFRLVVKKHGNDIFKVGGLKGQETKRLSDNWDNFNKWANAKTGVPFIDANMEELNATGFMSNRGRQNVASYLINDLKVNWQMGAEYFESKLIDYDVGSNWVNWLYIAGVGNDPRDERYFHPISQAKRYDPQGDYVKHWLPHLKHIPYDKVHEYSSLGDPQAH